LSCMKVNADIYCLHSASFQSPVKESREFITRGGRRLLHNISTGSGSDRVLSWPSWACELLRTGRYRSRY